ncbi:MAG: NAD(P)-binding domain-containing protein [Steroidobacteraceae bacterium]|nr:NAD(P)-binding domain-containing protein [Steroidobacteraceae bacterium]MDW8259877.1 NAD(P)-binding domain-containing protein [Gammaproteobacteria bacterium]
MPAADPRAPIGFVGVGLMGGAIARRLVAKGFAVLAYDTNPQTLERITAHGVTAARSTREVADRCEIVLACLPTAEICKAVALGDGGVAGGKRVQVYVETSTIGSAAADEIAQGLSRHGVAYVDAPVVGGVIAC